MMTILIAAIACMVLTVFVVLHHPRFGNDPEGNRLQRVEASPNYTDGKFKNLIPTPALVEGQSTAKIILSNLFRKRTGLRPTTPLPAIKTELSGPEAPPLEKDILIWLGHSSFYLQLGGKRILVDPVFSDYGAPFSFLNKAFAGTTLYSADDLPRIDVLLISHDHWDHLDYDTVTALLPKVNTVVCPLGLGANLEEWGYPLERIHEEDWGTTITIDKDLRVSVVPARHYSGRLFSRNKTLWAGFVIENPNHRLFLSGDTGYGPHFKSLAQRFGPFDLVALDGGQYAPRWPLIHMTPEEAINAARDLKTDAMILGHVGRFCISAHPWDEPFKRAVTAARDKTFRLLTPKIGEPVRLDDMTRNFSRWWEQNEAPSLP